MATLEHFHSRAATSSNKANWIRPASAHDNPNLPRSVVTDGWPKGSRLSIGPDQTRGVCAYSPTMPQAVCGSTAAPEPVRPKRHPTRVLKQFALCALTVGLLAGCGSETEPSPSAVESASAAAEPTDLTCPTDERVGTAGGLLAEAPDGFDTREEAVEEWLRGGSHEGDDYIIFSDGTGAWILRADGTAHTKVSFLRSKGFVVHGYESCSS